LRGLSVQPGCDHGHYEVFEDSSAIDHDKLMKINPLRIHLDIWVRDRKPEKS